MCVDGAGVVHSSKISCKFCYQVVLVVVGYLMG